MSKNIDTKTLYTLNYSNITQLVEDLNRNFAVIQNSPLFKGIPGKPGDGGDPGPLGTRGSKILFVDVDVFISSFPNEIRIGSDITLDYIQLKLDGFYTKQILLDIWGLTEFVNQDIIVLTNSTMLQYVNGKLTNTNISFREETTILSNIDKVIEEKVKYYVDNNPIILGLKNVFNTFDTIYKNYSDTNNVHINNTLLKSSIIAPYVPGYSNNIGIKADANDGIKKDHTYFGFSDNLFNIYKSGTIVFGSIARYSQMLMASVSTSQQGTLTSDYVPGVDNIPIGIFLQDDANSGLLIGKRTDLNLMRFASIYKDINHSLIIKSDSSKNPNEYSSIELNKNYLTYRKLVNFHDNLTVGGKFILSGDIQSPYIKTGTEIYPEGSGIVSGPKKIQIGYRNIINGTIPSDAAIDLITSNIYLSNLTTKNSGRTVITTGQTDGKISTQYSIDTRTPITTEYFGITKYTMFNRPTSNVDIDWVVTSNQLFGVQSKINGLIDYMTDASTGYWRKNQYDTGVIPSIQIGNFFKLSKDSAVFIGGIDKNTSWLYRESTDANIVNFGFPVTKNSRLNVSFDSVVLEEYQAGLVLVTESGGLVSKKYTIFGNSELTEVNGFVIVSSDNFKFLNKTHFQYLLAYTKQEVKTLNNNITNNYWSKNQFKQLVPIIPTIRLINDLYSDSFKINDKNNLEIGRTSLAGKVQIINQLELNSIDGISVPNWTAAIPVKDKAWSHNAVGIKNNVLVPLNWRYPNNMDIRNYTLETMYSTPYVTSDAWNTETKQDILCTRVLSENWWWWLLDKVNKLYSVVNAPTDDNDFDTNSDAWNYWSKTDFANGLDRPIPALYLAGVLDTSGVTFNFGKLNDRTIQGNGNSLVLGTSVGIVTLRNQVEYPRYTETFIYSKANGIVDDTQRIPLTTYPKPAEILVESPYSVDDTNSARNTGFTVETTKDGLINIPIEQQLLTLKWAKWIEKFINQMKAAMKTIYSAVRTENRITARMYEHVPVGSIIAFSPYIGIPTGTDYEQWGWAICNGTPVNRAGTTYNTPDLRDRFIKAVGTQTEAGKATPTTQEATDLGVTLEQLENQVYIIGNKLPKHQHNIITNKMSSSGPNQFDLSHSHKLGDTGGMPGSRTLTSPFFRGEESTNTTYYTYHEVVPNYITRDVNAWGKTSVCTIYSDIIPPATQSSGVTKRVESNGQRSNGKNDPIHWYQRQGAIDDFNTRYPTIDVATSIFATNTYYNSINIEHSHTVDPANVTGPTTNNGVLFKLYIKQYSLVYLMKVPRNVRTTGSIVTGFNVSTATNATTTIDTLW